MDQSQQPARTRNRRDGETQREFHERLQREDDAGKSKPTPKTGGKAK